MNTKRILATTIIGILFIAALVGVMLLTPFLRRDYDAIPLPDISASSFTAGDAEPDMLTRIEVTRENIQPVISTLSRPETYSRDVIIESCWEGGKTVYNINVSVAGGVTSLSTLSSSGIEKNIIVTPDFLYIWYRGDRTPFTGSNDSSGDDYANADEYQMLITYEDVIRLDRNYILDAGYTEYGDEECVYAEYLQPKLGYTMKCYISIELGLITGAEEYDAAGTLTYRMSAGECVFDVDASAFMLPDGTFVQ